MIYMQAGVWDVDGTGMQAIEDPDVDLGIRKVIHQLLCLPRVSLAQSGNCVLFEHYGLSDWWTCAVHSNCAGVICVCVFAQKVVYGVGAGAVATLFVMVPYIFWPF